MKYLFVVPPFFGHISPTLSVGAGLIDRGHQVMWVGIRELGGEHIPPGGKFVVPREELAEYQPEISRILKRQDDGPGVSGPGISGAEMIKLALEETYIPFCRFIMKGLCRITDEFRPDVIVSDCITFAGGICAYNKGIPYATTTPVPPDLADDVSNLPKIDAWQNNLINGLQQEFGIYTKKRVMHSDRLNLVFTSKEFAAVPDPPAHMKFVGPVNGRPGSVPFDWERLKRAASPKVYVTLGTLLVDVRKAFFEKLIAAFAGQPLTLVVATDPGLFDKWPDNFIVQGFVPQSQLIAEMDAVICHGGFNTVNDTFLNGLPMLITPIAYDQFHTASLIEKAGCGVKIRYKRLRVNDLQAALWEVLENKRYRVAAGKVRNTFLAAGGSERAVQHLEEFAL